MASSAAHNEPIDTTDDPVLEAKWQALVQAVVDAKTAAATAKRAWGDACDERGPDTSASPEAHAKVAAAKAAYDAACAAVDEAGARMKAGL